MAAESFVVFTEHWSGMALLSREQRGDLLEALMAMHGACEMPELDQATAIVLAMIRPRMEANRKRYEETVAKRKANGALGGRPSKKQTEPEKTLTLQEQPQGSENNLKDSEETIRFSEKPNGSAKNPVYGSDPDYVNTTYSDPPLPPLQGEPTADAPGESELAEADTHASPEPMPLEPEKLPEDDQGQDAKPSMPSRRKADFVDWYQAYPRKKGRDEAVRAWDAACRAKRLPPLAALLETLSWQKESFDWTKEGGRWIPNPATYLRAGSWQDEPPARKRRYYGPDANGRTPYVREDEQDFENVPRDANGGVDWAQVMGGAK